MANVFETEIGHSFREAGAFTFKFMDGLYSARPGDFLVMSGGRGIIVECKMTTGSSLPMSTWSTSQRAHFDEVEKAGGSYLLIVNWRDKKLGPKGWAAAFDAVALRKLLGDVRGSFRPQNELCVSIPSVAKGWDVSGMLTYLTDHQPAGAD